MLEACWRGEQACDIVGSQGFAIHGLPYRVVAKGRDARVRACRWRKYSCVHQGMHPASGRRASDCATRCWIMEDTCVNAGGMVFGWGTWPSCTAEASDDSQNTRQLHEALRALWPPTEPHFHRARQAGTSVAPPKQPNTGVDAAAQFLPPSLLPSTAPPCQSAVRRDKWGPNHPKSKVKGGGSLVATTSAWNLSHCPTAPPSKTTRIRWC